MRTPADRQPDWQAWWSRWELQQAHDMPQREERFRVMLELVATLLGDDRPFTLLDLACGTGAIARRALERFPRAAVVGVDADPLLLAIAAANLSDGGGRLTLVRADLTAASWRAALPVGAVDVVLSSTALHWLPAGALVRLYRDLALLMRPGGLFLNAEHLAAAPPESTLAQASHSTAKRLAQQARAEADQPSETWETWWDATRAEPGFAALLAERERLFHDHPHEPTLTAAFHAETLRMVGFAETAVVWRWFDNAVLAARR